MMYAKANYLAFAVAILFSTPQTASAYGKPHLWIGKDLAGVPCRQKAEPAIPNDLGPYNYTNPQHRKGMLPKVEAHHYTSKMKALLGGNTGSIAGDLNYTLHMFPNHHHALFTLVRLYTENCALCRPKKVPVATWKRKLPSPECYLNRALGLHKNDPMLYAIYGIYLHRIDMLDESAQKYERSLELRSNIPEVHYNYGLLLFDLGRYEEAQKHAEKAAKLGYPLSGLQRKLKQKMKENKAKTKTISNS